MSLLMRSTAGIVFVVLLACSVSAWATSASLTTPAPRAMSPLNGEQLDLRADRQAKDASQKRLRMRQVLLLWLLAAQPPK